MLPKFRFGILHQDPQYTCHIRNEHLNAELALTGMHVGQILNGAGPGWYRCCSVNEHRTEAFTRVHVFREQTSFSAWLGEHPGQEFCGNRIKKY